MSQSVAHKLPADDAVFERSNLAAEVIERRDTLGAWGVEAIDNADDGSIFMAVFYGPDAHHLAVEYATAKYANVTIRQ